MPTEFIREFSERITGDQGRQVAHETDDSDGGGGGFLGNLVRRHDAEEGLESLSATSKDKEKKKRDDVVLTEALNILADLVKLTGGNEAPDTPDASTSAFWSILGGEQ